MAKKQKNKLLQWAFGIGLAIMIVLIMNLSIDVFIPRPNYSDYCDPVARGPDTIPDNKECNDEYQEVRQSHDFKVFMIFSVVGLMLVIASLFINMTFIEVATMLSGFILMILGLARNFDNKQQALISGIIITVLLVFVGVRKLKDLG